MSRLALRKGTQKRPTERLVSERAQRLPVAPRGPTPLVIGAAIHAPPVQTRPVRNTVLLEINFLIRDQCVPYIVIARRLFVRTLRHCLTPSLYFTLSLVFGCPSLTLVVTFTIVTQLSRLER